MMVVMVVLFVVEQWLWYKHNGNVGFYYKHCNSAIYYKVRKRKVVLIFNFLQNFIVTSFRLDGFVCFKLCSHRGKVDPKANIFFDACHLFFDIFHFFNLFLFRFRFRLVWIIPYASSVSFQGFPFQD